MKKYFGISIFMILIFLNLSAFAKNLSNPNTDSIYFGDKSIEIKSNKIINALKVTGKFEQFQNNVSLEGNKILLDNFQLPNNIDKDKMVPDEFKNFAIDKIAHEDFIKNTKMPLKAAQINLPRPAQMNMTAAGQSPQMPNGGNMLPMNPPGANMAPAGQKPPMPNGMGNMMPPNPLGPNMPI